MTKGLLIFNPKAGQQDESLLPRLVAELGDVEALSFDEIGEPATIPERAAALGCSWVAAAGGDGTIEAVASALLDGPLPLGVITAGTYNNFARSLDLPLDPLEACGVIKAGRARPIDVGCASGQPFFECLGSGMDAALYPLGEEIKSGRVHRLIDFFHRAYHYRPEKFTLTFDRPACHALVRGTTNESHRVVHRVARNRAATITLPALMVTVSNGPYFGMNFAVAPEQRMDDGLLTVSVFCRYSKIQLWWRFASIAFGRREYCPKQVAFRVGSVRIEGPHPLPVHLDGTPKEGLWPIDAKCRPGALKVFCRPEA